MPGLGIKTAMKEKIMCRCLHWLRICIASIVKFALLPAMAITFVMVTGIAQAKLPDYDILDEILGRNVRNGFVDYDGIAAEPQLGEFIEQLGKTQPAELTSADIRLAFYINAYNILAIQGILDGQSPSNRRGRRKFFRQQTFDMLGEQISLDTLEHEYINMLDEPRIHFAIVCASIACPRLSSRAYRAEELNVQLHEATKRFINDLTRNRFDTERRIAFLSEIFDRYADDFIAAGGSLQGYLARFIADAPVQDALRLGEFEIRFVDYDWNLNGRYGGAD